MPQPDPTLVQIALDAWQAASRGDRATLERLCGPEIVWHASGRGRWSGERKGLDAMFEYLGEVGEASEQFSSELQDVLVSETRAAVFFHVTGRRNGKVLDTDFILIFEIVDGLIRSLSAVPRDQLAVDDFWA